MASITLHPTAHRDVFTDGSDFEPMYQRSVERGEVQFWHQSGYGYLPESRVIVTPPPSDADGQPLEPSEAKDAAKGGRDGN